MGTQHNNELLCVFRIEHQEMIIVEAYRKSFKYERLSGFVGRSMEER